ncbi:MAG: 2-dehydropantoate 2-reductase [Alphaproteobacteria bacterium]|nr:2-dehydropantoate 2-reductase [Alphaproteobacteria bacterium]
MRVVIVGAGAIGGWLGGGLARAGHDVAFVARGRTLAALRRDGLIVREGDRSAEFEVEASDDPAKLGACDYVVLALKGQDVAGVAPTLRPLFDADTAVVSTMNGLPWWFLDGFGGPLAGQTLASVDPKGATLASIEGRRVIGGVVHGSTRLDAPGVVRIVKIDRLLLGEPDGEGSPRLAALAEAFAKGDVPVVQTGNIRMEIWAKLWGNMNLNPLSALARATMARMLGDRMLFGLAAGMMREMDEVGAKIGLKMTMAAEDRLALAAKLGDFKTSMLQDLEADRPLEIEPLLGVVVELADALKLELPLCRGVLGTVRQLEVSRTMARQAKASEGGAS